MSLPPERSRKPSVEDLLRLKRAERPDADFWKDFERGLREKQLAAIVEPKPWWLGLSILFGKIPAGGWAASAVSAGAAAAFAIMAATTQTASTTPGDLARQTPEVAATTPAPVVVASAPITAPPPFAAAPDLARAADGAPDLARAVIAESPALALSEPVPVQEPVNESPSIAPAAPEQAPLPANATILLAAADARPPVPSDSLTLQPAPSFLGQAEARLDRIATPLLEIVASGFSPAPAMITGLAPAAVPALASAPAMNEPELPEAISPRHARLLNAIAYEAEEKDLAQARDRVVHRLSTGEELYASVTRLGVRGDRLSVSF